MSHQEIVTTYVNPGKWLNISWLLKEFELKSILMAIGLSTYVLLSLGFLAGELEKYESGCLHCRLKSAGITSTTASRSARKLMRYHGVKVMKTVNDEAYILYKGKWERIHTGRPT